MTTPAFSRNESLRYGWNAMKQHFGFFIILQVIMLLVSGVLNYLDKQFQDGNSGILFLLDAVSAVVNILMSIGIIKITLDIAYDRKATYTSLYSGFPVFFQFIGTSILYALITAAGLLLLIVPGIIWGTRFRFFSYLVIDKGMGPITALRTSYHMTKGSVWNLIILELYCGLIALAGVAAIFVGLLVAIPTILMTRAKVYKALADAYGV